MAEKKPAAKKPAAKAPVKKPAAKKAAATPFPKKSAVENGILTSPAEQAGLANPNPTFGENTRYAADAQRVFSEYVDAANRAGKAPKKRPATSPNSRGRAAGTVDAAKGKTAAEKAAERVARGVEGAAKPAPKPTVNRRGNLQKAGEVATSEVKKTSSARKMLREGSAKAQAKADFLADLRAQTERENAMKPRIAPTTLEQESDSASVYQPAGWALNRETPHTKMMGKLSEMEAMVGPMGANLPGVSRDFQQDIHDRIQSARMSHQEAFSHAVNGRPLQALNRAREAHETLQSVAYQLSSTLSNTKKFSTKAFGRLVARHGSMLNAAISDQKTNSKNMDVNKSRLRDENAPIVGGRFAGVPRSQNPGDNVTYERNPNRAKFNHASVVSVANIAAAHSLDPQTRALGGSAIAHSKAFGDAVANGDKQAVLGHGRALVAHLDALYAAAKNREATTVTNTPQMQETVLTNLRKHISAAKQGVAMFTGER